jgi:hypothetical protein
MKDVETLLRARGIIRNAMYDPEAEQFDWIGAVGIGNEGLFIHEWATKPFPATYNEDLARFLIEQGFTEEGFGEVQIEYCYLDPDNHDTDY